MPTSTQDTGAGVSRNLRAAAPASVACPFCASAGVEAIYQRSFQNQTWNLTRCRACGLHFTTPFPTLDDLRRFYAGDYHHRLCQPGAAERVFGPKFARYRDWVLKFAARGRSLDVGCSTGLLPYMLRQAGFEAEGLELNPESAAWGSAHYGITIRNLPVESGEYPEAAYDLVSLTDVLEHTIHPLTSLRAIHRIVKPGGHVLITFPDILSLESRYFHRLARGLRRDWLWSTCHIPLHTWEFTRATAAAMFRAAGFEIAGFRRSQPKFTASRDSWILWVLSLPPAPLSLPGVSRQLGTQMEFMLRKPSTGEGSASSNHARNMRR